MNNSRTRGTAFVIVVISAITLVGALGFVFWQNITSETSDTPEASGNPKTVNADPYKGWNDYTSINGKYSIKYPTNWSALKETAQDGPYIRNFDPASKQSQSGYPDGYINVRVLREENNANFKAATGYSTSEWYEALGKIKVQNGPTVHLPEDVRELKISGLPAKSTKAVFTETDEVIYILRGDELYSINLYPYGISSDQTVKLMLDSFTFTY